jgi:hypothetical protein
MLAPVALDRLRDWGLGEQPQKGAAASAVAWVLSGLIPGTGTGPGSFLAPLTALLTALAG